MPAKMVPSRGSSARCPSATRHALCLPSCFTEAPAFPTQKLKVFNQKAVDWCSIQSQLPLRVDREITTGFGGV
jgi:hypothetical protein